MEKKEMDSKDTDMKLRGTLTLYEDEQRKKKQHRRFTIFRE